MIKNLVTIYNFTLNRYLLFNEKFYLLKKKGLYVKKDYVSIVLT